MAFQFLPFIFGVKKRVRYSRQACQYISVHSTRGSTHMFMCERSSFEPFLSLVLAGRMYQSLCLTYSIDLPSADRPKLREPLTIVSLLRLLMLKAMMSGCSFGSGLPRIGLGAFE